MPDNPEVLEILKDLQVRMVCLEHAASSGSIDREKLARAIFRLRRGRHQLLGEGLFSDNGWDILLELYLAECAGYRLQTSALGQESGIPQTTMLRYVNLYVDKGLLVREPDASDGRRIYVHLRRHAVAMIEELLDRSVVELNDAERSTEQASTNGNRTNVSDDTTLFFTKS